MCWCMKVAFSLRMVCVLQDHDSVSYPSQLPNVNYDFPNPRPNPLFLDDLVARVSSSDSWSTSIPSSVISVSIRHQHDRLLKICEWVKQEWGIWNTLF